MCVCEREREKERQQTDIIIMLSPIGRRFAGLAVLLVFDISPLASAAVEVSSIWSLFSSSADHHPSDAVKESSELVSPIVHRELEAMVKAPSWPFTFHNIACEAWLDQHGDWDWMDRLVLELTKMDGHHAVLTYQQVTDLVLQVTEGAMEKAMLEYSLSLRAQSPQCELHRGMAREHILQQPTLNQNVFVVQEEQLLPDEPARHGGNSSSSSSSSEIHVLYANLISMEFVRAYQLLIQSNHTFVVRHLGNVAFEEFGGSEDGVVDDVVVLQGYGVRLDIKNVEYKVFEDSKGKPDDAFINVTQLSTISNHMLAGVNLSMLLGTDHHDHDLKLQAALWKIHEGQQRNSQRLPPKWQRRQLPLQATTVIAAAAAHQDVLIALEDISQNLPSVASTLVHVTIPTNIRTMAKHLEDAQLDAGSGRGVSLSINGRQIDINRPSFNVFELLKVLRQEQTALGDMKKRLGKLLDNDIAALQKVQKAWAMGETLFLGKENGGSSVESSQNKAVRIDVARGFQQSIIYVNDVERDVQYRQWPRQVKQMLFAMQYGAPPSVRRNMFTILAVVDPMKVVGQHAALQLGGQLLHAGYPVRMGVLFVSQEDIDACATWSAKNGVNSEDPCPVKSILNNGGKIPTIEDLDAYTASTQAVHRLFSLVTTRFAGQGISPEYMDHLILKLAQNAERKGGVLKMAELVTLHAQLLESIGVMERAKAVDMALEALSEDEDIDEDKLPLYGKALRFAMNKGIKPGMGFLNGRVLPGNDETQEIGAVFMAEQQHIFDLVMKGEITDTSPKSVYGMILKGANVFPRIHPLLGGGSDSKFAHMDLEHEFTTTDSLLYPKSFSFESIVPPTAVYVVEAFIDFDSVEGQSLATSFISVMDAFPDSVGQVDGGTKASIAYRLIPTTDGLKSREMCSILSKANAIGASGLVAFLSRSAETDDEMRSCGAEVPKDFTATNFITANGRVFVPDAPLVPEDMDLLLELELKRSKVTTQLLASNRPYGESSYHDVIAATAKFLAIKHKESNAGREDLLVQIDQIEESAEIDNNPLRFSFNMDSIDELRISVTAIVDPVTESAQRVAPLLRAMRDNLKLPLTLILAPRSLMHADDKISSYYRFVAEPRNFPDQAPPKAIFSNLPTIHILTLQLDTPESWNIQQSFTIQDTDNLRCDLHSGCSDDAHVGEIDHSVPAQDRRYVTRVEYELKNLLFFGQCYDAVSKSPPNGLMLTLTKKEAVTRFVTAEIGADGSVDMPPLDEPLMVYSDTLVMKTVGYWQLRGAPGVWNLNIAPSSRGAEIFDVVEGKISRRSGITVTGPAANNGTKTIVMKDFVGHGELLLVKRRPGYEKATLFYENEAKKASRSDSEEVINVFSLATGHLYERFLKIMMLSVTKRTSTKVKFWLFENFLSPSFKASAKHMAHEIGCEVEFVTYKWPEWLRGQSEKQRIIWGYKILFLDVLFPLDVKKIIYVDADQVVRGDLKELWEMDLKGAPYGYTPMCSSRESTLGFQFWRGGFWESHLRGKPYHISALYVVDLEKFRKDLVGDVLRSTYQQLSADPNSLSNLDQDLPNYAQHQVPIFSLPQEWLWCESWCSDESKNASKTIDLCNNPLHKEPKVSMAKRIISGDLFEESWIDLDAEVERYEKEYLAGTTRA